MTLTGERQIFDGGDGILEYLQRPATSSAAVSSSVLMIPALAVWRTSEVVR